MGSNRFQDFYDDVCSGAFPEYEMFRPMKSWRADGALTTRPPTRNELREILKEHTWEGGPEWVELRRQKMASVLEKGSKRGET